MQVCHLLHVHVYVKPHILSSNLMYISQSTTADVSEENDLETHS